ncbi:TPA: 6-phospho-3-hexuloisomerase, partial [Klebsiella pneumoniae]|nr:6-phospho-3-hexuloisomerase [Klebsiella pneumoniae]
MQAKELREILQELTGLAEHVNQADVDKLIAEIEGANKLFLAGAGRSGFMIRA